jgi:hypothetical protein
VLKADGQLPLKHSSLSYALFPFCISSFKTDKYK